MTNRKAHLKHGSFAIPAAQSAKSVEADEAARKHKAELKRQAHEPVPPGKLAALVSHLSTKERRK